MLGHPVGGPGAEGVLEMLQQCLHAQVTTVTIVWASGESQARPEGTVWATGHVWACSSVMSSVMNCAEAAGSRQLVEKTYLGGLTGCGFLRCLTIPRQAVLRSIPDTSAPAWASWEGCVNRRNMSSSSASQAALNHVLARCLCGVRSMGSMPERCMREQGICCTRRSQHRLLCLSN